MLCESVKWIEVEPKLHPEFSKRRVALLTRGTAHFFSFPRRVALREPKEQAAPVCFEPVRLMASNVGNGVSTNGRSVECMSDTGAPNNALGS